MTKLKVWPHLEGHIPPNPPFRERLRLAIGILRGHPVGFRIGVHDEPFTLFVTPDTVLSACVVVPPRGQTGLFLKARPDQIRTSKIDGPVFFDPGSGA